MDDFFDDWEDSFEHGDFMDNSDGDFETDDPFDEESEIEEEATDDVCDDEIPIGDAVFIGGTMMGWAYEEGIEEGKRKKLEKKMDEDHKSNNRND